MLNRREVLMLSASAVALSAAPMPALAVIESAAAPLPVWAVGTPGEWDWKVAAGISEHEAKLDWLEGWANETCEHGGEAGLRDGCECDGCEAYYSLEANRHPKWDGKNVQAGDADWFNAGYGANCDRCGYETDADFSCGRVVGREVVCEDCLTLADWDIIDPEHAAELREEADSRG